MMGISSDGILYFGFVIAEDDNVPAFLEEIGDHDFELFLIKEAGMSYEEDWCESHSIEYKEPKWLLCRMYG